MLTPLIVLSVSTVCVVVSQFLSYDAMRMRVPGRCPPGDFDCGLGHCVSILQFRDGKPDCMDGSDEWCFVGQVSCGPVYCADYKHALPCLIHPKCDGTDKQLPWCSATKDKLCTDPSSFPCKGYGECVLWNWLLDGKSDCIDGSDEDLDYVMSIEAAIRCARNQTGIVLEKPVPPPPADHPPLFVPGCSFCKKPENIETTSKPSERLMFMTSPKTISTTTSPLFPSYPYFGTTKERSLSSTIPPATFTTPKYPFMGPLTLSTSRKYGTPTTPLYPFFGTITTRKPVESSIFPMEPSASLPSGYPTPPSRAVYPTAPSLPDITSTKHTPYATLIPDPTRAPLENFPPFIDPNIGEFFPNPEKTTKIGDFFPTESNKWWPVTETTPNYLEPVTQSPRTRIPAIQPENSKQFGRLLPPIRIGGASFPELLVPYVTRAKTTTIQPTKITMTTQTMFTTKLIEEQEKLNGREEVEGTNFFATSGPNIIHIGPGMETSTETSKVRVTTQNIIGTTVMSTEKSEQKFSTSRSRQTTSATTTGFMETEQPSTSFSTISTTISSTTESSTQTVSTTPVSESEADGKNTEHCLKDLKGPTTSDEVTCPCEGGFYWDTSTNNCEVSPNLVIFKIDVVSPCTEQLTPTDKRIIAFNQLSSKLGNKTCIQENSIDDHIVASISNCTDCRLEDLQKKLNVNEKNLNMSINGFETNICDSPASYCHVYSDCSPGDNGITYKCQCQNGTTDISNGHGYKCDGFPADSDCIMLFGICLIVWCLFLLGSLVASLLMCILCYSVCPLCCKKVSIHPQDAQGLQNVVVGEGRGRQAVEAGVKGSKGKKVIHVKTMFAESLKHSAKESSNVASAFALADFRRKQRVSKAPDVCKVEEEDIHEVARETSTDANLHKISSAPNVHTLPKVSTQTSSSEPPTPAGCVVETPILEKHSSSMSLVSSNENAPQLPNLPLPLPVPVSTGSPTPENVPEPEHKRVEAEPERRSSSHSIGVQPTIWETYRVLGNQYAKSDSEERKKSLDSLEKLVEERLASHQLVIPNPVETVSEERKLDKDEKQEKLEVLEPFQPQKMQQEEIPTENLEKKENKDDSEFGAVESNAPDQSNVSVSDSLEQDQPTDESGASGIETQRQIDDEKLNIFAPLVSTSTATDELEDTRDLVESSCSPIQLSVAETLNQSLEAALLVELAKRGIELPLSPKPDTESPQKASQSEEASMEELGRRLERRVATARSLDTERRPKTSVKSRCSSAKLAKSRSSDLFVPSGLKRHNSMRKPSKSKVPEAGLTDESDPEVAFFKKFDKTRPIPLPMFTTKKTVIKRRRPERTLSSISEKSAEVSADACNDDSLNKSVSCPTTTRTFLEPSAPPKRRFIFKRKVVEAENEASDVDVPKLTPASVVQPIVSSPEIPDVTRERSMENLTRASSAKSVKSVVSTTGSTRSSVRAKKARTNPSSAASSMHTTPRNGEDTGSHTSRSTRHSVISRKIAIRKHELKHCAASAGELRTPSNRQQSYRNKSARSTGEMSRKRPEWNYSRPRDNEKTRQFLPPIHSKRVARTTNNSPVPKTRRSNSHFSMASLPATRSPTSFWSSPYFTPSQDSRKPPKEDLWWNPAKSFR